MAGGAQDNGMKACPNCAAPVTGLYCQSCGQKHLSAGLDSGEIASEVFDSVVRLDSKLWHTLISLTKNPGQVAADYAAGKRARFVNPLRYCFAAIAISIAAMLATGEIESVSQSMLPSVGAETQKQKLEEFFSFFSKYLNLMSLLSVPVFALAMRGLFWKAGRNFAECLAFSCFVLGHGALLGVIATLFNSYVYFLGIWPSAVINTVLPIWGTMVFFRCNIWIASTMFSFASMAYLSALMLLTLGLMRSGGM